MSGSPLYDFWQKEKERKAKRSIFSLEAAFDGIGDAFNSPGNFAKWMTRMHVSTAPWIIAFTVLTSRQENLFWGITDAPEFRRSYVQKPDYKFGDNVDTKAIFRNVADNLLAPEIKTMEIMGFGSFTDNMTEQFGDFAGNTIKRAQQIRAENVRKREAGIEP